MIEIFDREPLETAFVYPGTPSRPYPLLDIDSISFLLIDMGLSVFGIMACLGMLARQKWAWFLAIPLHVVVFTLFLVASISVGKDSSGVGFIGSFDGSTGRYATMVISLISLYLLSSRNVREYFRGAVKQAA